LVFTLKNNTDCDFLPTGGKKQVFPAITIFARTVFCFSTQWQKLAEFQVLLV